MGKRKLTKVDWFETPGLAREEKNRREASMGRYVIKKRKPTKKYPYHRYDLFRSREEWEI